MKRIFAKLLCLLLLIGFAAVPLTNSNYLDTETSLGNSFTAGCWSAPTVPTLLSPADNSYLNTADVILNWSDSAFVCPGETVEYQYDWNGVSSAWQSASTATITAPAEGVYTWTVRARDSQGYVSADSAVWTVTVDRTAPLTTMSFHTALINEKVSNGGFESGLTDWNTRGQVVLQVGNDGYASPYSGTRMVRIGHRTAVTGNEIWENRIRQRIEPGAKNLSFYYNFFSFDTVLDDPGMVVRINDYNVFYLSAADIDSGDSPNSSGWQQLSFDISGISDPQLEILFYSGNTGDAANQSWVYIDNITTAEAVAEDTTPFTLIPADSLSGVASTWYSLDSGLTWNSGTAFTLASVAGSANVLFYSADNAGNSEGYNLRRLVKDTQAPGAIGDLSATAITKQTVELDWTVPVDWPSGKNPAVYDIRYSPTPILNDTDFASASVVPNPPAPRLAGESKDFTVTGLDPDTLYYFSVKAADAALNWSVLSNMVSAQTLDEVVADPDLNPGEVVINELMWMGSSKNADDEWIELRNMTDMAIDLTNWQLTRNNSGAETLMFTIPSGTLSARGYFLISEYDKANSAIDIDPDVVVGAGNTNDANFVLADTDMQIKLYKGDWTNPANLMDMADNALETPAVGAHNDAENRHWSMERDATPGDGTRADVWHTCVDDSALMHSYWDAGRSDKGTPGRENISQPPASPEPISSMLSLTYADHAAAFTVTNIDHFNQLKYTLTYDSDSGEQGIAAVKELTGETQIEVKDLLLGTCSSGGTCVYHEGVTKINLEVVLSGAVERTLTQTLSL